MSLSKDLHPMQLDCLGHLSATFQVIPEHELPPEFKGRPVLAWNAKAVYMLEDVPEDMLKACTDNQHDFWRWYDVWLSGEGEEDDEP